MADWQKVNMNKSIPSCIRNDTQMDVRVFYLFQTGAPQSDGVYVLADAWLVWDRSLSVVNEVFTLNIFPVLI